MERIRDQKMFNVWKHSGILHIYQTQDQGIAQMYEDAKNSKKIYAIASLGKTFSYTMSPLNELLCKQDCDIKFLLLNPDSLSAQKRLDELGLHGYIDDIRSSIKELGKITHIKLALYDEDLYFRVYLFDNVMYLRFRLDNKYTAGTQTWRIGKNSYLYRSFHRQFDDLWKKHGT